MGIYLATFTKEKHLQYEVQIVNTFMTYDDFLITWNCKLIRCQQLCESCVKLSKNSLLLRGLF